MRLKDYQLDNLRKELSDEKQRVRAKSEAVAKIARELESTRARAEEARSLSVRLEQEIKKSESKSDEQTRLSNELESVELERTKLKVIFLNLNPR